MLNTLKLKKIAVTLTISATLLGCGHQKPTPGASLKPAAFSPSDLYGQWRLVRIITSNLQNGDRDEHLEGSTAVNNSDFRALEVNSEGLIFGNREVGERLLSFPRQGEPLIFSDSNSNVRFEFQVNLIDNQLRLLRQDQNDTSTLTLIYDRAPSGAPSWGEREDSETLPPPRVIARRRRPNLPEVAPSQVHVSPSDHREEEDLGAFLLPAQAGRASHLSRRCNRHHTLRALRPETRH